jgi:methyltransferase family protein
MTLRARVGRVVAGRLPRLYRLVRCIGERPSAFLLWARPGHFYSPVPDMDEVVANAGRLFGPSPEAVPGVDLRAEAQLALMERFAAFHDEFPFPREPGAGTRYYSGNVFFGSGDAVVLYSVLRLFRPRRVVEVGSGFSSALMLDVDERFLGRSVDFTFVEPYPERLLGLLRPDDSARQRVLRRPVQEVPPELFAALDAGDLLFVDSSHVVKIGSDVEYLLGKVLPSLRPGVIVHFHDIGWPFEYPREWVLEGRAWNEAYFLRSFLQFNAAFEILYFNAYLESCHPEAVAAKLPACAGGGGASLWLRRAR